MLGFTTCYTGRPAKANGPRNFGRLPGPTPKRWPDGPGNRLGPAPIRESRFAPNVGPPAHGPPRAPKHLTNQTLHQQTWTFPPAGATIFPTSLTIVRFQLGRRPASGQPAGPTTHHWRGAPGGNQWRGGSPTWAPPANFGPTNGPGTGPGRPHSPAPARVAVPFPAPGKWAGPARNPTRRLNFGTTLRPPGTYFDSSRGTPNPSIQGPRNGALLRAFLGSSTTTGPGPNGNEPPASRA